MSVSPAQKRSKPPPGAGDPDRHLDTGVLGLELLGPGGDKRADGAGAVDLDAA